MFPTSQYMAADQMYGAPYAPAMAAPNAALNGSVGGSYRAGFSGSASAIALIALIGLALLIGHMR